MFVLCLTFVMYCLPLQMSDYENLVFHSWGNVIFLNKFQSRIVDLDTSADIEIIY